MELGYMAESLSKTKLLADISSIIEQEKTKVPSSFKEEILKQYSLVQLTKLTTLISETSTLDELYRQVTLFLNSNWHLVKSTMLCYTAQPKHAATKLMTSLADSVAYRQTSTASLLEKTLSALMPGSYFDENIKSSITSANIFNTTTESETTSDSETTCVTTSPEPRLTVQQVLTSHILSDSGTYLIPIWTLLAVINPEVTLDNVQIFNYHYQYEDNESNTYITAEEFQRLENHSDSSLQLIQAKRHLSALLLDKSDLYGQLISLATELNLYSVKGIGEEKVASRQAEIAIRKFFDYYKLLSTEKIEDLPPELQTKLNIEIQYLRKCIGKYLPGEKHITPLDTCLATRRKKLLEAIKGSEAELSAITIEGEQKSSIFVRSQRTLTTQAQQLNSDFYSGNYQGQDALPLNINILKELNIDVKIPSLDDLIFLLQSLNTAELMLLNREFGFLEKANTLIKNIDDLVTLHLSVKPDVFLRFVESTQLEVMQKLFKTPLSLKRFIDFFDVDTAQSILSAMATFVSYNLDLLYDIVLEDLNFLLVVDDIYSPTDSEAESVEIKFETLLIFIQALPTPYKKESIFKKHINAFVASLNSFDQVISLSKHISSEILSLYVETIASNTYLHHKLISSNHVDTINLLKLIEKLLPIKSQALDFLINSNIEVIKAYLKSQDHLPTFLCNPLNMIELLIKCRATNRLALLNSVSHCLTDKPAILLSIFENFPELSQEIIISVFELPERPTDDFTLEDWLTVFNNFEAGNHLKLYQLFSNQIIRTVNNDIPSFYFLKETLESSVFSALCKDCLSEKFIRNWRFETLVLFSSKAENHDAIEINFKKWHAMNGDSLSLSEDNIEQILPLLPSFFKAIKSAEINHSLYQKIKNQISNFISHNPDYIATWLRAISNLGEVKKQEYSSSRFFAPTTLSDSTSQLLTFEFNKYKDQLKASQLTSYNLAWLIASFPSPQSDFCFSHQNYNLAEILSLPSSICFDMSIPNLVINIINKQPSQQNNALLINHFLMLLFSCDLHDQAEILISKYFSIAIELFNQPENRSLRKHISKLSPTIAGRIDTSFETKLTHNVSTVSQLIITLADFDHLHQATLIEKFKVSVKPTSLSPTEEKTATKVSPPHTSLVDLTESLSPTIRSNIFNNYPLDVIELIKTPADLKLLFTCLSVENQKLYNNHLLLLARSLVNDYYDFQHLIPFMKKSTFLELDEHFTNIIFDQFYEIDSTTIKYNKTISLLDTSEVKPYDNFAIAKKRVYSVYLELLRKLSTPEEMIRFKQCIEQTILNLAHSFTAETPTIFFTKQSNRLEKLRSLMDSSHNAAYFFKNSNRVFPITNQWCSKDAKDDPLLEMFWTNFKNTFLTDTSDFHPIGHANPIQFFKDIDMSLSFAPREEFRNWTANIPHSSSLPMI